MKKRVLIFVFLFLLYLTVSVLAIYGARCVFFHKCDSVSPVITTMSGAGSDGVVQVWEGKRGKK